MSYLTPIVSSEIFNVDRAKQEFLNIMRRFQFANLREYYRVSNWYYNVSISHIILLLKIINAGSRKKDTRVPN